MHLLPSFVFSFDFSIKLVCEVICLDLLRIFNKGLSILFFSSPIFSIVLTELVSPSLSLSPSIFTFLLSIEFLSSASSGIASSRVFLSIILLSDLIFPCFI